MEQIERGAVSHQPLLNRLLLRLIQHTKQVLPQMCFIVYILAHILPALCVRGNRSLIYEPARRYISPQSLLDTLFNTNLQRGSCPVSPDSKGVGSYAHPRG